jgi:hypothetical protein
MRKNEDNLWKNADKQGQVGMKKLQYKKVMSNNLSIFTYGLSYIFQSHESTYSAYYIKSTYAYLPISYDMRLYHMILCAALGITNHAQKKYRSTMVTSRPWTRFKISQQILLLFWSGMSAVVLITSRSWIYAQIHTGRKSHWALLPKRS